MSIDNYNIEESNLEIYFVEFDKTKPCFEPKKASKDASGYDLCNANEEYILKPGEIKLFDTNIALNMPHGFEGQVRSRSGLALKNGIMVLNSPGTIDCDYKGPIGVILANFGKEPVTIEHGMRISQLVFANVCIVDLKHGEKLLKTKRGAGGFGSTGTK